MAVQTVAESFTSYRQWATDPQPRIPFGMEWFDGPTGGGLARSEWCLLQAFSSVGKTTVALNIIRNNPALPILLFSMEMNWRMVGARLAAMELATSTKELELRAKNGDPLHELQAVADKYRGLICDDQSEITFKKADESFERATDRLGTPPRLVVWDYLELIGGGGLMGKSEQIDKVAVKIRSWNRDHDCSSIVLHQLSQGTGGYKPMSMHEGRYGGYQPADFVAGAYAPRLNPDLDAAGFAEVQNDIYFQLLKSRSGAPDPIGKRYTLHPKTMRIEKHSFMPSIQVPSVKFTAPPPPVLERMPPELDDEPDDSPWDNDPRLTPRDDEEQF